MSKRNIVIPIIIVAVHMTSLNRLVIPFILYYDIIGWGEATVQMEERSSYARLTHDLLS